MKNRKLKELVTDLNIGINFCSVRVENNIITWINGFKGVKNYNFSVNLNEEYIEVLELEDVCENISDKVFSNWIYARLIGWIIDFCKSKELKLIFSLKNKDLQNYLKSIFPNLIYKNTNKNALIVEDINELEKMYTEVQNYVKSKWYFNG